MYINCDRKIDTIITGEKRELIIFEEGLSVTMSVVLVMTLFCAGTIVSFLKDKKQQEEKIMEASLQRGESQTSSDKNYIDTDNKEWI